MPQEDGMSSGGESLEGLFISEGGPLFPYLFLDGWLGKGSHPYHVFLAVLLQKAGGTPESSHPRICVCSVLPALAIRASAL